MLEILSSFFNLRENVGGPFFIFLFFQNEGLCWRTFLHILFLRDNAGDVFFFLRTCSRISSFFFQNEGQCLRTFLHFFRMKDNAGDPFFFFII
jgi:hypothetical protein